MADLQTFSGTWGRKPLDFGALLSLVLTLGACDPPSGEAGVSQADPATEVEAFLEQYLKASSARDTARLRDFYVDDGRFVWMEDGRVQYRSIEEVFAGLGSLPPDMALHTETTDLSVSVIGLSGAHAWTDFVTTVGDGAQGFQFGGLLSFVLEKRGEGWRIVGGHTSSVREQ